MSDKNKEAPSFPSTPIRRIKPMDDTSDKLINSPINTPPPKNVSTFKIDCPKRLKFSTCFKDCYINF